MEGREGGGGGPKTQMTVWMIAPFHGGWERVPPCVPGGFPAQLPEETHHWSLAHPGGEVEALAEDNTYLQNDAEGIFQKGSPAR